VALTGVLLAAAVPARAGEVKVSFSNGLVTIVATDASPRQILGEWAKLGHVRITNLERLTGAPVTVQFTNVPEAQVLETLLRGTAGYVAAPRVSTGDVAALSRYDRILLMPGTAPAVTAPAPAPTTVNRGRPIAMPTFDPQDDDQPDQQPRMMPAPPGPAREFQRSGGTMPPAMMTPGQTLAPGQVILPGQSVSPGQSPAGQSTTPGTPYQLAPGSQIPTYPVPQPPGASGTAVPGMPTTPAPVPGMPYPASGATQQPEDAPPMPGLPVPARLPGAAPTALPAGVPGSPAPGAATPGAPTAPPAPPGPIKKNPGGKD
jgi:hypothetical protein